MDHGVECRERNAHVGRMRGDAGVGGAEDRVHAVEAVDARRSPAPRLPLVAARGAVVEVVAPRPLHQVAADRGHVADLAGGAATGWPATAADSAREQPGGPRPPCCARRRRSKGRRLARSSICGERQAGHIDQRVRLLDVFAHQVDEVGAAAQELRVRTLATSASASAAVVARA